MATGTLRDSLTAEVQDGSGDVLVSGRVYTNETAGYAKAVEYGTKPHYAPIAPLKAWAALVLGDQEAAYAVRGAIAKRGTRAQPFFAPAVAHAEQTAPGVFRVALARIAQQLQGS